MGARRRTVPLPLGHTAIGWAAYETAYKPDSCRSRVAMFIFVAVLANLPDLDVLYGLIVNGNGYAFHRGPTHSLLFAVLAGYLASRAGRVWRRIPQLGFGLCVLLIFSHVAADMLLTAAPVSLFWPFELHWVTSYNGWSGIIHLALFQSVNDFIIAAVAMLYLFGLRLFKKEVCLYSGLFAFAKRITK
jgi:membrane-bound metal-dependent hydrolase YbcI (DUF457 family)